MARKEGEPSGENQKDGESLTPEALAKKEAMDAPLPMGEAFKAALIEEEIKDAERKRIDEKEIGKLQGDLLKVYLDNYDKAIEGKIISPAAREKMDRQKRIDARELEEEIRAYGLNNVEKRLDAVGFGRAYRDYLLGEEYRTAPDKVMAREKWKKDFWTPEKIAEDKRIRAEMLEKTRQENKEVKKEEVTEKPKRSWFSWLRREK